MTGRAARVGRGLDASHGKDAITVAAALDESVPLPLVPKPVANAREWLEGTEPLRYATGDLIHRRILVCGSRTFSDRELFRSVLSEYMTPPEIDEPTLMHGGAKGADTLAKEEGLDLGFWVEEYPADWKKHGKAAGPIRNRAMLSMQPDLVIAFGDGRGTSDCVREAERRGIPVRREGAADG